MPGTSKQGAASMTDRHNGGYLWLQIECSRCMTPNEVDLAALDHPMTTKGQAAIRNLFKDSRDSAGNLPPMPGIFPDYPAPIVRNADGGRELTIAHWGMPSSSQALFEATKKRAAKLEAKGKQVDFKELLRVEPDKGTTNIRNVESKH